MDVIEQAKKQQSVRELANRCTFIHCGKYGVIGNTYNVQLTGRTIGYLPSAAHVGEFIAGHGYSFTPVSNWRVTFGVRLRNTLGLA